MDIDLLRKICTQLPNVTEDIKWEQDLCFSIGHKMFCVSGLNASFKVSIKVTEEEFDELCSSENIIPAPYLARYKWILITDANRFSGKEWEYYIFQSYQLIKEKLPGKVKKELGL